MSRKYIGYQDENTLPIKKGQTVTIPKGTTLQSTHPQMRTKVAGRTYKIVVDHVLPGITFTEFHCNRRLEETSGPKKNPSVRWAGTGGYWFEVDINDVPEVNVS